MKILAIGDVFGSVGRRMLKQHLLKIKQQNNIDLTIVNIENTTNGRGISLEHYQELKKLGIDVMTSGNHIFDREETLNFIKDETTLLRPANASPYQPGNGTVIIEKNNKKIRITNLQGTVFLVPTGNNPYYILENIINKNECDLHFIDFHAEATGEKMALAKYFDGKITGFWGTHTHVQTADEYITEKGTSYITDLGFTGPSEGIIGAEPSLIFKNKRDGLPLRIIPCSGKGQINGIIIEIDENTNKAIKIERIFLKE